MGIECCFLQQSSGRNYILGSAGVICDSNRAKKARYPSVVGCTKGEQRYPPDSDFFATF